MARDQDDKESPYTRIVEAYAYHEMLAGEFEGSSSSEWDSYSEFEDSDDSDDDSQGDSDQSDDNKSTRSNDGEDGITGPLADDEKHSEDEGPAPILFRLRLDDPLTLFGPKTPDQSHCSNAQVRRDMWISNPKLKLEKQNMGFLAQLGQLCIRAGVRRCEYKDCKKMKESMKLAAPSCKWKTFREWAIVAMSCQAALDKERKLTKAHTHLSRVVSACCMTLKSCLKEKTFENKILNGPQPEVVDLASVCNVIYWMATIQAQLGIGPKGFGRWDRTLLPRNITLPDVEKATVAAQKVGVCKNRLWSLVNLSERKEGDLPDIIKTLEGRQEDFRHPGHDYCTPSKCQFAQMNSTKVQQLHKCGKPEDCKQKKFPVDLLETYLALGKGTSWLRDKPRLCSPDDEYIAISHVWSDGTGVGVKDAGSVNSCLFASFAEIAKELKCTGVWWDALSIPAEPRARSLALNRMHANYTNAKHTVVHDSYLLNFEWKGDGSPCLAIVLSPWFTRGWTALELAMSDSVQVLFKPQDGVPVIKDLDEILAKDPGSHSRAHWLASQLIKRLRKPVNNVSDLLAILNPRFTSWARDRTEIAGLLAGVPDCDFTRGESEIVRDILKYIGTIPYSCLLHGRPTMCDAGGFSWCAATLDEMPIDLATDMEGGSLAKKEGLLQIDREGAIEGLLWCRKLTQKDAQKKLKPYGHDLAVEVKITTALRHWRSCLLLRQRPKGSEPALLVMTVGADAEGTLECRYVGAVQEEQDPEKPTEAEAEAEAEAETDEWEQEQIRIGNDVEDADGQQPPKEKPAIHVSKAYSLMFDAMWAADGPAADEGSESGSLHPSDADQSSDEEESARTKDNEAKLQKGAATTPWYLHPDVQEYRPKDLVRNEDEDEGAADPDSPDANTLFNAVRVRQKKVVRHLIREHRVDFTDEAKNGLAGQLDASKESTFSKLRMLGDVYFENGQLIDAENMYNRAIQGLRELNPENVQRLVAMHALGRIYVMQKRFDEAITQFCDVLESCTQKETEEKEKMMREAKEKRKLEEAKQKKPDNGTAADYHDNNNNNTSIPPTTAAAKESASASAEKKQPPVGRDVQRKNSEWHEVELDTIAALGLLYANQGRLIDAAKVYRRALAKYGEPPELLEAFTYDWSERTALAYEARNQRDTDAATVYHRAVRRFERDLGKEHLLTLTTVLSRGINYSLQGKNTEAEVLYRQALTGFQKVLYPQALAGCQKVPAPEDALVLITVRHLAVLLTSEYVPEESKKWTEADNMHQRAIDGFSSHPAFGPRHMMTLLSLSDWGVHCLTQKPNKAENFFHQVKDGLKKKLSPNHRLTLGAICNIGRACEKQGKLRTAEKQFKLALRGLQTVGGLKDEDLDVCHVHWCLGRLYNNPTKDKDKAKEPRPEGDAESELRKCFNGYKTSAGPNAMATLKAARLLGSVYEGQNELKKAKEMFEQALKGFDQELGPFHLPTLKTARHLGSLYIRLGVGEHSNAEAMLQRAYKGFNMTLKPNHPKTLEAASALGALYLEHGKLNLAAKHKKLALDGYEASHGKNDTLILQAATALGTVYEAMEKWDDAEKLYVRAIEGFEKAKSKAKSSNDDVRVKLIPLLKLGDVYREQGSKLHMAEPKINAALEESTRVFGPNALETLQATLSLGRLKLKQEDTTTAESLIQRAINGFKNLGRADDINTIDATASLGYLYAADPDQSGKAIEELTIALEGYEKVLIPGHSSRLLVMHRLVELYKKQGLDEKSSKMRQRFETAIGEVSPDQSSWLSKTFRALEPTRRIRSIDPVLNNFKYDSDDEDDLEDEDSIGEEGEEEEEYDDDDDDDDGDGWADTWLQDLARRQNIVTVDQGTQTDSDWGLSSTGDTSFSSWREPAPMSHTEPRGGQPSVQQPRDRPSVQLPNIQQPSVQQPKVPQLRNQPRVQSRDKQPRVQSSVQQPSGPQPRDWPIVQWPSVQQPRDRPSAELTVQPSVQQPKVHPRSDQPSVRSKDQKPNFQQPRDRPNVQWPSVQQPSVQQPRDGSSAQQPSVQQPKVEPSVQKPKVHQPRDQPRVRPNDELNDQRPRGESRNQQPSVQQLKKREEAPTPNQYTFPYRILQPDQQRKDRLSADRRQRSREDDSASRLSRSPRRSGSSKPSIGKEPAQVSQETLEGILTITVGRFNPRTMCRTCKSEFVSRNKLFQHLDETIHHADGPIGYYPTRQPLYSDINPRFFEYDGVKYWQKWVVNLMPFDVERNCYATRDQNGNMHYITPNKVIYDQRMNNWGVFYGRTWHPLTSEAREDQPAECKQQ